jgi:hypothetical protein
MILGLGITTFTLLHVLVSLVSLVGLVAGLVVVGALISGRHLGGWTTTFLVTTVLTNISGFGFPVPRFLPSHWVGVVSLLILPVAILALYGKRLAGRWRTIYVVGAVAALYLNAFVLVAQLFQHTPALRALAPTQRELPFAATQLFVLAMFVVLGRAALAGFTADAAPRLETAAAGQRTAIT